MLDLDYHIERVVVVIFLFFSKFFIKTMYFKTTIFDLPFFLSEFTWQDA